VKEFIEDILGDEGRARSVVVAAPADAPPLVRMQGAAYATAIAEHFRDRGQHVLLLMDSLTRYAMAQREIALAIGEPPATKGYPPSCFAKLPQLVERSGNGLHGVGSITAFYTVLSEGDDQQDPIADAARGILDGHIVLSRELAERPLPGHRRRAFDLARDDGRGPARHQAAARRLRQLLAQGQQGARPDPARRLPAPGHDAELDLAVRLQPQMNACCSRTCTTRRPLDASDYREEYTQRWSRQFGQGGTMEIVQCYQSFMQRLDEAMSLVHDQLQRSEATVAARRAELTAAELRTASVRKLIERRRQERGRVQARVEQKLGDEAAQAIVRRTQGRGLSLHH
jgi:flagellar export protein FliJ